MDQLAPIIDRAQPCAVDTDCQPTYFCVGDEVEKRCLRAATARCGDGLVQRGEACDDGNHEDDDACPNTCQLAACGDGLVRRDLGAGEVGYEACDDGNNEAKDACSNRCARAQCGDGIRRQDIVEGAPGYEACDDGNQDQHDACTNDCTVARCGDGIIRDDLFAGNPAAEECDDGNEADNDRCDSSCRATRCGDGIPQEGAGEVCDDANQIDADACTNGCLLARCGDGIVRLDVQLGQAGFEACDDGNAVDDDDCPNSCMAGAVAVLGCGRNMVVQMANGQVMAFGSMTGGKIRLLEGIEGVASLDCDARISVSASICARTQQGAVYCYDGETTSWPLAAQGPFEAIAIGEGHGCGLNALGHVWCWGSNTWGQLGQSPDEFPERAEPVRVEGLGTIVQITAIHRSNCALDEEGAVSCWGSNSYGQTGAGVPSSPIPRQIPGLPPARQVVSHPLFNCALSTVDDEDQVNCWGNGNWSDPFELVPIPMPATRLLRIQIDRRLTGMDGERTQPSGTFVLNGIDPSYSFWRLSWRGSLVGGAGGAQRMDLPLGTRALATTAAGYDDEHPRASACALTTQGAIWCWGDNGNGMLGQGTYPYHGVPQKVVGLSGAVELAFGQMHSCARLGDGTVRCWGSDRHNQLGSAERTAVGAPPVTVTGLTQAVQIVAGSYHSCARLEDGSARCWGQQGKLGDGGVGEGDVPVVVDAQAGPIAQLAAGWTFTLMLRHDEEGGFSFVHGFGDTPWRDQVMNAGGASYSRPAFVARLPLSQALVAGKGYACTHLETGEVRCWGANNCDQLGFGRNRCAQCPPGEGSDWTDAFAIEGLGPVAQVAAQYSRTCVRRLDGSVHCFGCSLRLESNGDLRAEHIDLGWYHGCALIEGGEVHCWGRNSSGERGDGIGANSGMPESTPRPVVGLPSVHYLGVGEYHSCAISEENGEVWCWGRNDRNQLGNGHAAESATPLRVPLFGPEDR